MAAAEAKLAKSLDSIIEESREPRKSKEPRKTSGMRVDGGSKRKIVSRVQAGRQQEAPRQRGGAGYGSGLGVQRNSGIRKARPAPRAAYTYDEGVDDGDYGMGGGRPRGPRGGARRQQDAYEAYPARGRPVPKGNPDAQWTHDLFDDTDAAPPRRMGGGRLAGRLGNGGGASAATSSRLKVSNLHYSVTKEDVEELFSACGNLRSATIMYDVSDRPTGDAFVEFERRADAVKAIQEYNGIKLDGQELSIEFTADTPSGHIVRRLASGRTVERPSAGRGLNYKRVMSDVLSEAVQGMGGRSGGMGGGMGGRADAQPRFQGRMQAGTSRGRLRSGVVKSKADLDAEMDTMMHD